MPYSFPDPRTAQDDGLVAVGGDLSIQTLFNAYSNGIFPWPYSEDSPLLWFSLDPRGVLEIDKLHISKSMKRFIRQSKYEIKFNTRFEEVIENCASVKRKDQADTWIDSRVKNAYLELFKNKKAYSVEVYNIEKKLVAGVYGTCFGELISGESMFHKETNTSKLALISLIEKLSESNIKFLDTQMITPVTSSLGAKEIPRESFLRHIQSLDLNVPRESIFN